MSDSPVPFPPMPDDVLRLIFETAARTDLRTTLTLVQVSHKLQSWIDFILYEIIILQQSTTTEAFARTMNDRPPSFFATHVKSLCIPIYTKTEHALKVISACIGVKKFACWLVPHISKPRASEFDTLLSLLRPTTLSVYLRFLSPAQYPDFTLPLFQNVTHLDIVDDWDDWVTWAWDDLERLTHLTHLSLDLSARHSSLDENALSSSIKNLLRRTPNLRVCVFYVPEDVDIETAQARLHRLGDRDLRLIPVPYESTFDNWKAHFRGEEDDWVRAERQLQCRIDADLGGSPEIATPNTMLLQAKAGGSLVKASTQSHS